ncbi:hypothetical protein [Nonomuraea sp. NPDC001023]|uniref:hypothetical protein n=1 Tax=unclassified Nonomuraea TaxID=2593643 RepID=UPI00332A04B3
MRTWTERPGRTDVEAVVRRYFGLLRAGRIAEAEQLVDHSSIRHVLRALWTGSAGADADAEEADRGPAAGEEERDLSWLGELDLGGIRWGHTDSHVCAEVTYRARTIEVSLGFWVKPTDAGWVLAGPSTLW